MTLCKMYFRVRTMLQASIQSVCCCLIVRFFVMDHSNMRHSFLVVIELPI